MKTKLITLLTLGLAIITSCSNDEDAATETNPINIIELTSSKKYAFIEESVVIAIQANGYSEIEVSSEDNIDLEIINDTTYIVTSEERTEATIEVTFTHGGFTKSENVDIEFVEHGFINDLTFEGIDIDIDGSEKTLAILGEPDYIQTTNDDIDYWYYFNQGFFLFMKTDVDQLHIVRAYSHDSWSRTFDETTYNGSAYLYSFGENDLKFSSDITSPLLMDSIISQYGTPDKIEYHPNDSRIHEYEYTDKQINFYFLSDTQNEHEGKPIQYAHFW